MSDTVSYQSQSPRFTLPFLFAGQAQKEFFVNEALARLDVLAHPAVEGELSASPPDPLDGQCWLIGAAPSGEWDGKEGWLAGWQAGDWVFVEPRDGMRVWDSTGRQWLAHDGGWNRPETPDSPSGGATIDGEARAAIDALIEALRNAGIFSAI